LQGYTVTDEQKLKNILFKRILCDVLLLRMAFGLRTYTLITCCNVVDILVCQT